MDKKVDAMMMLVLQQVTVFCGVIVRKDVNMLRLLKRDLRA